MGFMASGTTRLTGPYPLGKSFSLQEECQNLIRGVSGLLGGATRLAAVDEGGVDPAIELVQVQRINAVLEPVVLRRQAPRLPRRGTPSAKRKACSCFAGGKRTWSGMASAIPAFKLSVAVQGGNLAAHRIFVDAGLGKLT